MDAQTFLGEFSHIANAPGGVERLREMIFTLAVKGRLVSQNDMEEPAEVQLYRITKKASFIQIKGRTRGAKRYDSAIKAALNEDLPNGWVKAYLCDLVRVLNGRAYSKEELLDKGTPVLRVGNLFTSDKWYYSDLNLDDDKYCENGDLLYAWSASFGPFIWDGERSIYHYHIWKLKLFSPEDLNMRFLYIWLLEKTRGIKASSHGISMVHMTKENFEHLIVDLPPKDEQARIIAKVDELISLCDHLEKNQKNRRLLKENLKKSLFSSVIENGNSEEAQFAWRKIENNIKILFKEVDDVSELRTLYESMAVRGMLANLDKVQDEVSAHDLLKSIALFKSGKRIAKASHPDELFPLPENWCWVLLEDLLYGSESGWSPKCDEEPRKLGEWGVLKVSAVTWGKFQPHENKRLPLYLSPKLEHEIKPGDFILSRANTVKLIARSVIVQEDAPDKLLMSDKIIRLKFVDWRLKKWVNLVNNSDISRDYYALNATGTIDSMRNVSRKVIHELPIPLPPLRVQEDILHKLSDINRILSTLGEFIQRERSLSNRLSRSAVDTLVGAFPTREEGESVKAPQTELIATLRLGSTPDIKAQATLATILARHQGEMNAKDLWQRFGGEIGAFYAQLKTEVANGWIQEPTVAEMREVLQSRVSV